MPTATSPHGRSERLSGADRREVDPAEPAVLSLRGLADPGWRGRLKRVDAVAADGSHVCSRCGGTGIEPAVIGGESPEDRTKRSAAAALAELERKVERSREVRNALGSGVVDAEVADEGTPGGPLRLVTHRP